MDKDAGDEEEQRLAKIARREGRDVGEERAAIELDPIMNAQVSINLL